MNCQEAKKISITAYLNSQGLKPNNIKNGCAWYCSPLRNENDASFKVDIDNNIWYDFGAGTGGNILDLVMHLNNTDVPGALKALYQTNLEKSTFSFSQQQVSDSSIEIKHIQPLQNRALIEYLNERGISQATAANYIKEAYYVVNEKRYFALAFENDKGGFELRNKYFKGSTSPKAITTIHGVNKKAVNLFEGFLDFISALQYFNFEKPNFNTIILNSLSNLSDVFHILSEYRKINLFLDNDTAGINAAESITNEYSYAVNQSSIIYPGTKDFNEFLTKSTTISRNYKHGKQ